MLDVDGVLVSGWPRDGAHIFTDLEADLGIFLDALRREFFKPRWPAIVTGQRALLPELADVLVSIAPNVSDEALAEYWFRNDSRIDPTALEAVAKIRDSGGRVYLATNQEHMRAATL
ncbi:MAG: hypothetical protein MO852_01870 [Candidatus Devosia euplotis]|nr:hypothetical protein [Candidatus Devosia euplotis]